MHLRTKVYLIDSYPQKLRGPFLGIKPPQIRDVILKLFGNHLRLQEETKRQSKLYDALRLTAKEVIEWWRCDISTKTENGIMEMLKKLYSNWKRLKNTRHRETKCLEMKRRKFVSNLTKTFWAVAPKCERELKKSSDPRKIEDWNFLQRMKTTREGGIGSIDKKFQDKQARRRYEARLLQKPNSSILDVHVNSTAETLADFEDDPNVEVSCSHEDPDFILPESSEHKCVKLREEVLTREAKLSHRNTAQQLGAALKQQGKEIDSITLSAMSVKRKRDHTMKNSAQSIMKNQLDNLHETDGIHYHLHWDEKVLKG